MGTDNDPPDSGELDDRPSITVKLDSEPLPYCLTVPDDRADEALRMWIFQLICESSPTPCEDVTLQCEQAFQWIRKGRQNDPVPLKSAV